ncbi:hypothetical protein [Corallococcus sp. AS-1-6]|uniref:hypothetical protein n=1 Tax=Corallococcus sp. AS-1-6 TaxID=2874599 RepID=UPI001CC02944|nr:hypothetical protein [Corallococcus sp. AS-1-6]MBZ4373224.1 hypothetical protein [Corallococcus sp. AS-1-6]
MASKRKKFEEQFSKFTGQDGGHRRDDRADAFAWPIYKYVCRKMKNVGGAERNAASVTPGNDEDDEGVS